MAAVEMSAGFLSERRAHSWLGPRNPALPGSLPGSLEALKIPSSGYHGYLAQLSLVPTVVRMPAVAAECGDCGLLSLLQGREPTPCWNTGPHCSAKLPFLDNWLVARVPRDLKLGVSPVSVSACSV